MLYFSRGNFTEMQIGATAFTLLQYIIKNAVTVIHIFIAIISDAHFQNCM